MRNIILSHALILYTVTVFTVSLYETKHVQLNCSLTSKA